MAEAPGREQSNLKTGLLGFATALVFIAVMMGISYWLAVH